MTLQTYIEGNQNKNNSLVSNFYDKLKSPALFSYLFRTEKSVESFNSLYLEIDRKAVVLILIYI